MGDKMNIENFLKTALKDVAIAGEDIEFDTVNGVKMLESILSTVQEDLEISGEIITIINPTLAGEVLAMSQVVGTIDSLIGIINSVGTKNNSLIEDYEKTKKDISKLVIIWRAQKKVIKKVLVEIEKKAITFSNPILNAENKITGGF